MRVFLIVLLALPPCVHAQRADDNVYRPMLREIDVRHGLTIEVQATLRFSFGNITDKFGWRTNQSEVFVTNAPRSFSITIAADFLGSGPPER